MPQSHPTTGPVRCLSPVRFLALKAEIRDRRNFTSVLFSWSHQATAWRSCSLMVWSNNSQSTGTPCDACTGIVRAPRGNLQCFSYITGSARGPYGTCKGAARHPSEQVRELTQPELAKIPHGRCIWPYGVRTGCSRADYNIKTRTGPVNL